MLEMNLEHWYGIGTLTSHSWIHYTVCWCVGWIRVSC